MPRMTFTETAIAVILGVLPGCSSAPADSTEVPAEVKDNLYVDMAHRWPQTTRIPVCFTNTASVNDATLRNNARVAVEGAWTRMAGLYFSGWGTCTRSSDGIKITWMKGRSSSGIGRGSDGSVGINLDENFNSYAVVHEFGHALGFAHEQNRPDNTTCLPCSSTNPCTDDQSSCINGFCRQGGNGDTLVTPFDSDSIMNYCGPNGSNLSPLDVVGARIAYADSKPIKLIDRDNYCLGVQGYDSHGAGARVETYYCDPDAADPKQDELWSMRPTSDGYSRIVNMVSGLCLGVVGIDSYSTNAAVEVYHCDPTSGDPRKDEEWRLVNAGDGYQFVQNRLKGFTLGRNHFVSGVGAAAMVSSDPMYQSAWKRLDTPVTHNRSTIKLLNSLSGLCAGLPGLDWKTGPANAEVFTCNFASNDGRQDEEWSVVNTSDGYFRLRNANNGLCLGVVGVDSHAAGASAEVYNCTPTSTDPKRDEEWKWEGDQASMGTRKLVNRLSGLCLGVRGFDSHTLGAGLEVYGCDSTPNRDEFWTAY